MAELAEQQQNMHQKLLYISCLSAAAASADFHQNLHTTVPALERLALDEYQPEEVKLEVSLQLVPLGVCSVIAPYTHLVQLIHTVTSSFILP